MNIITKKIKDSGRDNFFEESIQGDYVKANPWLAPYMAALNDEIFKAVDSAINKTLPPDSYEDNESVSIKKDPFFDFVTILASASSNLFVYFLECSNVKGVHKSVLFSYVKLILSYLERCIGKEAVVNSVRAYMMDESEKILERIATDFAAIESQHEIKH